MNLPLPSAPLAILALVLFFPQVVLQPLLLVALCGTTQTAPRWQSGSKVDGGSLVAYRIACTLGYRDLTQAPSPLMSRSDLQSTAHIDLESYRTMEECVCVFWGFGPVFWRACEEELAKAGSRAEGLWESCPQLCRARHLHSCYAQSGSWGTQPNWLCTKGNQPRAGGTDPAPCLQHVKLRVI